MERIEVITSVQRRRRYTGQEKAVLAPIHSSFFLA